MEPKASTPGLLRGLGPYAATAIIVGTVIGSGIFKKPQVVAGSVPFFVPTMLLWAACGLLALIGALALAEVAVLYPKAGGNYVFLRQAFGPGCGFLWGWVEMGIIKAATVAALGTLLADTVRDLADNPVMDPVWQATGGTVMRQWLDAAWIRRGLSIVSILFLALINVFGVKPGGWLQLLITLVKVGAIAGLALLPLVIVFWPAAIHGEPVRISHWRPLWPVDGVWNWSGIGTATVGVLWTYHGWMNVTPVAEEVRNPRRDIPFAFMAGIGIVSVLYIGINVAYRSTMSAEHMSTLRGTTVAAEMSRLLLGARGSAVASAVVLVSVFGGLNGNILVGSRVLYALGEDRLAPRSLARVHPRYRTPDRSILILGAWSAVLIIVTGWLLDHPLPSLGFSGWRIDLNPPAGKPLFDVMCDFSMFGAAVFETLAVGTIFVFRHREPSLERPYRCWGYPLVPIAYVAIMSAVVVSMLFNQRTEAAVGVTFMALGAVCYRIVSWRSHAKQ